MTLIDGKKVSSEIIQNIKEEIKKINKKIGFAIIWVGDDEASSIYINNKIKKCDEVGIYSELYHLTGDVNEDDLIKLIHSLNENDSIHGILVQSPLPESINYERVVNEIDYLKDTDGFTNKSIGNLVLGTPLNISCTPKGIMKLLDYYKIDLDGKNVCIINRSNIVGKPLIHLMLEKNATVTVCHSHTKNLSEITKNADVLVSAIGKHSFISKDMVKEGAVVIDVGISRIDGKVKGDVDFESVKEVASYITPVPGGVGPMTIAMVLENILNSYKEINK